MNKTNLLNTQQQETKKHGGSNNWTGQIQHNEIPRSKIPFKQPVP
jgi:hypothetical protein